MIFETYHADDNEMLAEALANVRKAIEVAKEEIKVLNEGNALAETLVAQIEATRDDVANKTGAPLAVKGEEGSAALAAADTKRQ